MNAYELKQLMSPVYSTGKEGHKFIPPKPISESVPLITGPVFKGVEHKNKYNPATEHKPKLDIPMSTPVLPVDASSFYIPMEEPKTDAGKMMAPPAYRGIRWWSFFHLVYFSFIKWMNEWHIRHMSADRILIFSSNSHKQLQ